MSATNVRTKEKIMQRNAATESNHTIGEWFDFGDMIERHAGK